MAKANFVPSKKTIKDDDLDGLVSNQNAHNYKGFFYGDNSEQKFYEGGAHFDYNDLCTRLYNIIQIQSADEKEQLLKTKDLGFPIGNNNQPKQLNMSRNKQIIACSNTLKSINSTKTNMLTKSYLLNNSKFRLSNQKYEHQTFKQGESNYKLTELQKKDEDNYMVKSSINMKTTNDNLELKKTLLNNKTINSGLNFLVNKSDVHFVTNQNGMNRSENSHSNTNIIDNINKKYKIPYYYDKKDINLQSRNQSYFNFNENSFLKNTITKEKKTFFLDSSCSKFENFHKENLRDNDFKKNTVNSADYKNKTKKEKENEIAKINSKQNKYTEIYGKKTTSNKEFPIHLVNNSNTKSRNPINEMISKGSVDKLTMSLSINLQANRKTLKQSLKNKPSEHNTYYAVDKKSFNNVSSKITESQREKTSNSTLLNNFLKTKQTASNFISLKKPDNSITNLNKKHSGIYKKEAVGLGFQDKFHQKFKPDSIMEKTKTVYGNINPNYMNLKKLEKKLEKNNRYFSYGK